MSDPDYKIKRLPGAARRAFEKISRFLFPLILFAIVGVWAQESYPTLSLISGVAFGLLLLFFMAFIGFHRPADTRCPQCTRVIEVDDERGPHGTFCMTCEHCGVRWDLGYGTGS
jgi:hypothetical protein